MLNILKKPMLTLACLAAIVTTTTPAEARDRYHRHRGGNDAAVAIGAGIVGLAIGAAVASDRRDRYRGDRYYHRRGYPQTYYYYDNQPRYRSYSYRDGQRWHNRGGRDRDGWRGSDGFRGRDWRENRRHDYRGYRQGW